MTAPTITCHCAECDRPLVPITRWFTTPADVRAEWKRAGLACHRARRLCQRCYFRAQRDDTVIDYERITRPRAELLEEWELLRGEGYTRAQASARIGITKDALEKALERERDSAA